MKRSIIIDTNLLVLLIAGLVEPKYIEKHKRCAGFSLGDFKSLSAHVAIADKLVLLPHTLSQTSDLLRSGLKGEAQARLAMAFKALVNVNEERLIPSRLAVARPEFARLGLTDAVLLASLDAGTVLLTVDHDLHAAALSRGLNALHFNQIRPRAPA